MAHCYWLMKSEPSAFSIQDLQKVRNQTTSWDGVRNFQARNFMRTMKKGDRVLFYHSNAEPPAVMGVAEVVTEAYPDNSAFNPKDVHYDPRSTPARPLWDLVDIKLVRIFPAPIPLDRLRQEPGLKRMELLRKGSRLSVQPVRPEEWKIVLKLAGS
ncbi:MAG: EVE domain-containing protein [Nitrospiraceae bacterium]|nr:EVE domain-containing protein [Nitrospiraceae bacterium]MSR25325.1 EVE domain-containing protein [Nitrospiraceae bacterium]